MAAIILEDGQTRRIVKGYRLTTNNRMEMLAAIEALRSLNGPRKVRLYADSQYLVNGMRLGWAKRWKERGWRRAGDAPALNPDLWNELLSLAAKHDIEWLWVRGHADDPLNEECDRLAVEAAQHHATCRDTVYEMQARRTRHSGGQ